MLAPHHFQLGDRTLSLDGQGLVELCPGHPSRVLAQAEMAALPQSVHDWRNAFWRRLRRANFHELEGDQWSSTYRTELDGWRYNWWEDRKEQQEGLSAEWLDPVVELLRLESLSVRFGVGAPPAGVRVETTTAPRPGGVVEVRSCWRPPGADSAACHSELWPLARAASAYRAAHPPHEIPSQLPERPLLAASDAPVTLGPGVYLLGPGRHAIDAQGPILLYGGPKATLVRLRARGAVGLEDVDVYARDDAAIQVEHGDLEISGGSWAIDPMTPGLRWKAGNARLAGVTLRGGRGGAIAVEGGEVHLERCTLSHAGAVVGGDLHRQATLRLARCSIDSAVRGVRVERNGRLMADHTRIHRPEEPAVRILDGGEAVLTDLSVVRAYNSGVVVHAEGRLEMRGGTVSHCGDRGVFIAGRAVLERVKVLGCKVGVASYGVELRLTQVDVEASQQGGVFIYGAGAQAYLERCTVHGSGDANLEVADSATVVSADGVYRGGRAAGVQARKGAVVSLRGGSIAYNAGAAAEAIEGGQVVLIGVQADGAQVGAIRSEEAP